jgi:hypothetical protein
MRGSFMHLTIVKVYTLVLSGARHEQQHSTVWILSTDFAWRCVADPSPWAIKLRVNDGIAVYRPWKEDALTL